MENERNMLAKGLHVLQDLAEHPQQGRGVSEVARAASLPVSTTHRLLGTLVDSGWAARVPDSSTYRIGPQVLHAAESLRGALGLGDMHSVLVDLSARVGETVILGTLVGGEFIYLDFVHGPGLLGIKGSVGRRGPLHCTATGKALLCALPAQRREEIIADLDLVGFTDATITDAGALREELDRCTRRGYTMTEEEYEVGVTSVGVPIQLEQDPDGVYAVCISAPTQRALPQVDAFHSALHDTLTLLRTSHMSPR